MRQHRSAVAIVYFKPDDAAGSSAAAGADVPGVVIMGAGLMAGVDDAVVRRGVQRAMDCVGEPDAGQVDARL